MPSHSRHTRALRLPEVRRRTGLSRTTIYRLVSKHRFPPPRKLTARVSAWPEDEIERWLLDKLRSNAA